MGKLVPPDGFAINELPTTPPSSNGKCILVNRLSSTLHTHPTSRHGLPNPPTSSSSSSTPGARGNHNEGYPHQFGTHRRSRRPTLPRVRPGNFIMPLRTRRYTSSQNRSVGITTRSVVHASHISNQTTRRSSPSSPNQNALTFSALCSLTSNLELTRLTNGAASPSAKNTPPLTPRALSNDGSETAKYPNSSPSAQRDHTGPQGETQDRATPRPAPPIGPPKGKLFVKISSARGLKPSYAPYAVCAFEWIESIAHEPKQDDDAIDQGVTSRDSDGGVPIKRYGSDMGRSMAIPMKSRQSSTTSLSDQKNFKNGRQVTDPRWDHEAVL